MSPINIILIIILFSQLICFNFPLQIKDSHFFDQFIRAAIVEILKIKDIHSITNDLSESCVNAFNETFFIIKNETNATDEEKSIRTYFFKKLIYDSSTNANDLSSYTNCMERKHEFDFSNCTREILNVNYFTVFVDYRNKILDYYNNNINITTYLVGICFLENCSEEDSRKLVHKLFNGTNLINESDVFNRIKVYSLNNRDHNYDNIFFKFIPLYIIIFHLLMIIFHKYLESFYKKIKEKYCGKRPKIIISPRLTDNEEELINNDNNSKIRKTVVAKKHKNYKIYIKALYDIEQNFEFLKKYENDNEIHNDTSLLYMNGIKGISMILFLFGSVYIDLFNSPITRQNISMFYDNISHPLFFVFYFGIKYAPKLLLCSSGFSLFYKFMCYLDNKFDIEKELIKVKEEEKSNKINKDNNDNDIKSIGSSSSLNTDKILKKYSLPFKYYFLFLFSQVHKYILYLLFIFYILFSLYDFALIFIDLGPMWAFFNNLLIKTSINFVSIVSSFFCFQGYFIKNFNKDSLLNYFWLLYQEVLYFIISSFIIFIGYYYHLRMDRIFLCIMIILFSFRMFYYGLASLIEVNAKEYFSFSDYNKFYNSLLYNYIYYVLGICFGIFHFVVQKRFTYMDCEKQKKQYLLGYTKLFKKVNRISKCSFYVLGIIFLVLTIVFSFGQYFSFKFNDSVEGYNEKTDYSVKLNGYENNFFIRIFMIIDTDIVVFLVNFMALFFYLKGENFVDKFLRLNFWSIVNKIYFSYLLLINPVILYIFYITESRIYFNIFNCYLYSFSCGIILFSLVILLYALFELPFKKCINLILKKYEVKVSEKRFDFMETNNVIKQIDNSKEGLDNFKGDNSSEEDNNEENDVEMTLKDNLINK